MLRGAGERNSRELTDYLDSLGLQRSAGTSVYHTRFACAAVAERVIESLPAYADIIRRPHLPLEGFKAARELALQALAGLKDDPRQMLLVKLRESFLPFPLGRNPMGNPGDLKQLTLDACRDEWKKRYHANGAILAVAGNIELSPDQGRRGKRFRRVAEISGTAAETRLAAEAGASRHSEKRADAYWNRVSAPAGD